MSVEKVDNDLNHWFSTYGLITAERILGRYQIQLPQKDLVEAIKNPVSFYHKLVEIPLINVLNGIVLQQANDYHVYVQKLYIDYLLSGETSKGDEGQGAATRETLERERQELLHLGEEYHNAEEEHNNTIAKSQAEIIKITREFNEAFEKCLSPTHAVLKQEGFDDAKSKVRQAMVHALIYCDVRDGKEFLFPDKMAEALNHKLSDDTKNKILGYASAMLKIVADFDSNVSSFLERAKDMHIQANSFRSQFYDTILRVVELMNLLPEYKIDPVQDAINREPLHFDKTIGI